MIEKIREVNDLLILKYQDDPYNLRKQKLIKVLLKDDDCFNKINIEDAYNIFNDLGINKLDRKKLYLLLKK